MEERREEKGAHVFFAERVSQKLTCSCRCYKKRVSRNWTRVFFALKADRAASGNAAAASSSSSVVARRWVQYSTKVRKS
jgi:hypothetical protein